MMFKKERVMQSVRELYGELWNKCMSDSNRSLDLTVGTHSGAQLLNTIRLSLLSTASDLHQYLKYAYHFVDK